MVEAGSKGRGSSANKGGGEGVDGDSAATAYATNGNENGDNSSRSGSQTPDQLLLLCRTLLLHAQERYHVHSVRTAERLRRREEAEAKAAEEAAAKGVRGGLAQMRKKLAVPSPRILQSCVSLGSKMLFERRIRETLRRVNRWLGQRLEETQKQQCDQLGVEWLSLSVFDFHAQFVVTFRRWVVADVHLASEQLTVTSTNPDTGVYRKVKFHSDSQFELYLKLALERLLRET